MATMRSRIAQSPAFDGDHILGAILFEDSLHREIGGRPFADYLWATKRIVPFLKVDRGLNPVADGVQLMKPIPDLDALLALGLKGQVFGTKMRSFVQLADAKGIAAIVDQQFAVARQILDAGLVPILEPEISIASPEKAAAEALLKAAILEHLGELTPGQHVMVKVTLPEIGRLLRRTGASPPHPAGPRAVRWLHEAGGRRPSYPEPRRHRQLFPRPDGRVAGNAE